ncbi:MAG: Uma2 family endonuclease, partial [Gammaproteobacteria bacterium]|nr:Uma2 family endonuclease [Gammaproteobacteria bacterium]
MGVLTMMKPAISGADLPYEDGIPLESDWHLDAMNLLIDILGHFWRDRSDVYIGGNMFVYFDPKQHKKYNFCGPDFFVVKGAAGKHRRDSWVVWEENRRAPNFVVELASPSTAEFDLDGKKDIYEQKLKTPEYVIYDPATKTLSGWRLLGGRYVA